MWKFIINNTSKNLKDEIKIKVVKASNTNGLKQRILSIIDTECMDRKFNKYEAINAINAIARTKFFIKTAPSKAPEFEYKYRVVREIQGEDDGLEYKMELLQGNLIFYTY